MGVLKERSGLLEGGQVLRTCTGSSVAGRGVGGAEATIRYLCVRLLSRASSFDQYRSCKVTPVIAIVSMTSQFQHCKVICY